MYKFYNFFVKNSKCKELVEPLRCHMVMLVRADNPLVEEQGLLADHNEVAKRKRCHLIDYFLIP